MKIIDGKPWFAPKLYGFGTGLPIAWQGWVVLAVFIVGASADAGFLRGALRIIGICVLLAVFGVITALKTEGGWRWRNGNR